MTEEEEQKVEEYLRKNAWFKADDLLWSHKDCLRECKLEIAYAIQINREIRKGNMTNLFKKIKQFFCDHKYVPTEVTLVSIWPMTTTYWRCEKCGRWST